MDAVYAGDAPPLEDVNRQLINLVEVYEHNVSGWVFSNFASLQLTLWHLDPLRANAFVPLPRWIKVPIHLRNYLEWISVMSNELNSRKNRDIDSPTSRSSYQHLLW